MKKLLLSTVLSLCVSLPLMAEGNQTAAPKAANSDHNTTQHAESNKTDKKKLAQQKIKEQMEREQKYAKEQKFYQGDEYDLKAAEVDPNSLPDVPILEPDYDFDITDVYRDDI